MSLSRIKNGTIYDPANGVNGEVRDLWIQDGKIIDRPPNADSFTEKTLDATGYVVMPGGIDMHCHIAGPKVNAGRKMTPDLKRTAPPIYRGEHTRSGTGGVVPSTFATGYLFASIGYTTAMDAAIPGLHARHAHEELQDTPILDKGFYLLFGNNHFVMKHLRNQDQNALDAYCAWLLESAKGYTIKIVNPGGVEDWKQISRKTIKELDSPVQNFGVTPRQIVRGLAGTADRLQLPHSVHIHCNNLGIPGNWETTLNTMESLEGHRGHLAHVQFHSYDGDPNDPASFSSATQKLVDYVNTHENITVDVGHINPGTTLSMTGDTPFSQFLHNINRNKWYTADCELESSCGVIPIEYRPQKSLINAVQWAIALEWYLLMEDPWRVIMTSDHPNGGAFYHYPEIIYLLMDRSFRLEFLSRMPEAIRERSVLADLEREYSLYEIAIITRAAPARVLGMKDKGHLGVGAHADITIYAPQQNRQEMFERPRWVYKDGQQVVADGEIQAHAFGKTYYTSPDFDQEFLPHIESWFNDNYSIRFRNYQIDSQEVPQAEEITCQLNLR